MPSTLSPEIQYIALVVGLFLVPRALQRFRLPSAVTCVVIGAVVGMGFHLFHDDATIRLLATLGIVSLFLFAGLEVDFEELHEGRLVLAQHVLVQLFVLAAGAYACSAVFGLTARPALLLALALLTPSTGFILDSLASFGLSSSERFWVKSKAIASELVALGVLFLTIQSARPKTFLVSTMALVAMILLLPPIFRVFARIIVPFAPKTEFTFLVIVSLLCAFITRELGVYYLVGAFVVGITAVRLRKDIPELSSEKLLGAVELFASFFIPFYFFKAGLQFRPEHFTLEAVGLAAAFLLIVLPLRVARVALHCRVALREPWRIGVRIGTAVLPTLVFTLVIAQILRDTFALPPALFGALVLFALINTLVPGIVLHVPPPAFDRPEAPKSREPQSAPPAAEGSGALDPKSTS